MSTLVPSRRFRFHFNRINMQRGDPRVWTVHTRGQCIQTEKIDCHVRVESQFKLAGPQPRATFVGKGRVFVYQGRVDIL